MAGTQIMAAVLLGLLVILEFSTVFIPIGMIGKDPKPVTPKGGRDAATAVVIALIMLTFACTDIQHETWPGVVQAGIGGVWIMQGARALYYAGQPVTRKMTAGSASRNVAVTFFVIAGLVYLFTQAV